MSAVVLNMVQGSAEWHSARRGIPTASMFDKIVTASGALSKSRDEYLARLVAEWALDRDLEDFGGTYWTERGHYIEEEAREYYAMRHGIEPRQVGLVFKDDDRMVAASPDALIGDDGNLELKAPMPQNHLLYYIRGALPRKYFAQTQGQIWVTGRQYTDFMSYCRDEQTDRLLPPLIVRVEPDEQYQEALDKHIPVFIEEVLEGRAKLANEGYGPGSAL